MSDIPRERQPHAALDLATRARKAQKIERLLELEKIPGHLRLLEVGAGSGGISHYFGTHVSGRFKVDAVDVVDSRATAEGFRYVTVHGTALPFPDSTFDVVISNHVIEHVGDIMAQRHHLAELHRVLNSDGVCYLAVPNRWMLIEPHYRLAFLSWWPERFRTPWLRLWGKGVHYDCRPLTRHALQRLLSEASFAPTQMHGRAVDVIYRTEHPDSVLYRYFIRYVPNGLYGLAGGIFPTLIYVLRKKRL